MKSRILITLVFCLGSFVLVAQKHGGKKKSETSHDGASSLTINDKCNKIESSDRIKNEMSPYRLDKITVTRVHYKAYAQVIEMAVPIYHTTKYKFIVNAEGVPIPLKFKVLDKPHKISSAKVLAESESSHFTYETPTDFEGTRIYVVIKVPADPEHNKGVRNRGCVLVGAGYEDIDF